MSLRRASTGRFCQQLLGDCDDRRMDDSPSGDDFFVTTAYDPDGTKYWIQVSPSFGATGPALIGFGSGPGRGPVLGFINRRCADD
jgi:hypothetical protein